MNVFFHSICAFILRIGFLLYGHWHDRYFHVKYTDIDYGVFSDATVFVWKGESPFKRPTYRYSPILSFLLIPNLLLHPDFGKLLFCVFDILTSLLIYYILRNYGVSSKMSKACFFLWSYNPMVIVISTRGSSDSIMTFLIMLLVFLFAKNNILAAGLVYGFAVHMKIYPIIYAATFYFMLSSASRIKLSGSKKLICVLYPSIAKFKFVFSAALGFLVPTIGFTYLYGTEYLNEAFLYHLKRRDIQHNFSPYFYILYLFDSLKPHLAWVFSFLSFFFQAFFIGLISWTFTCSKMLPSCLFIETFIFVTFNKVCTSQYFLWYLSIFPLCVPLLTKYRKETAYGFITWLLGQAVWLIPAYLLEYKGCNTLFYIFLASVLFLIINMCLIILYVKFIMKPSLSYKKDV